MYYNNILGYFVLQLSKLWYQTQVSFIKVAKDWTWTEPDKNGYWKEEAWGDKYHDHPLYLIENMKHQSISSNTTYIF